MPKDDYEQMYPKVLFYLHLGLVYAQYQSQKSIVKESEEIWYYGLMIA
tara:strand:- start:1498 stop:1641 length:144 start_codon:yes stop_codon:yes gene_type:complete